MNQAKNADKKSKLLITYINWRRNKLSSRKQWLFTMSTNELVAKNFFIEPNVFLSFDI